MKIVLAFAFTEPDAVRLLNWLAGVNARILRAQPDLPGLYRSGVVYQRESEETWSDYLTLLLQGWEDCDALSAARAGELIARGWRALAPDEPGYLEARRARLTSIPAEVFLRTRNPPGVPGLYHCLTRYRVGGRWHVDDPSARLGMHGRRLSSPEVQARLAKQTPLPASRWRSTPTRRAA